MRIRDTIRILLLAVATPAALVAAESRNRDCEGCMEKSNGQAACGAALEPAASDKANAAVKRHPLKGVITAVHADRSAVMVKHEEIPGVMRAMTMLFKVDAATLKSAQKGQAITGLISRQGNDWVLEEVKVVAGKAN